MIKEAMKYVTELKEQAMEPKIVEINGRTYCDKELRRYDVNEKASPLTVSTLTALVDYIKGCTEELRDKMIIQIKSPSEITLISGLDEERNREKLITVEADLPHFKANRWVTQDKSMFVKTSDLEAIMKVAGNIEAKTTANYGDDGVTQKTTIQQGVASRADVIVPNPVSLIPYRTFLEITQPESSFVFRIDGSDNMPEFTLIEADGGLWVNQAKAEIKKYLEKNLKELGTNIVIMA